MELFQIIQQLLQKRQMEEQKRREAYAQRLNNNVYRQQEGPYQGHPAHQGAGGIYSDSLPFTLEDFLRTQKPGLWQNYQEPVPDVTPRMEKNYMKPNPPYKGSV